MDYIFYLVLWFIILLTIYIYIYMYVVKYFFSRRNNFYAVHRHSTTCETRVLSWHVNCRIHLHHTIITAIVITLHTSLTLMEIWTSSQIDCTLLSWLHADRSIYIYIYWHVSNVHKNIHRFTNTSAYTEVSNILAANMCNNSIIFVDVNEMS